MERQDLLDALGDVMRGEPRDDLFGGRLSPHRPVKSRLLEAHPPEDSGDGVERLVRDRYEGAGLTVKRVAGEDMWALTSDDDVHLLDTLNHRFWLLHSTAPSQTLTSLLAKHVFNSTCLDRTWFSTAQLADQEGDRLWVRSTYNSATLQPEQVGGRVARRWSVQVEGDDPDALLEVLKGDDRFRAGAVLTGAASRLTGPGSEEVKVAADYRGSFVSTGNDFNPVAAMLWRTMDKYEAYIRGLEDAFQMGALGTEEQGFTVDGEVATIEFESAVEDLDSLVANLFTCKDPFRLWAVPRRLSRHQWEANAVDLHVGQPLRIEVSSNWLRIMLGPDTCGNTLARLVANLQHRLDARLGVNPAVAA